MDTKYEIKIVRENHEISVELVRDGKVVTYDNLSRLDKFSVLAILAEIHNEFADILITDQKNF